MQSLNHATPAMTATATCEEESRRNYIVRNIITFPSSILNIGV